MTRDPRYDDRSPAEVSISEPREPEARAPEVGGSEVAIIGMACRFPGADTVDAFWRNLRDGVESLRELSDEELRAAGVPEELMANPGYVRRASVLEGIENFDAGFFGYTPLEATVMEPQHRLFLECSWEAFEGAGYDPARIGKPVGVFTGAKTNTYLFSLVAERERFPGLDNFQIALGNDLAAMATRVSYKLDLRGPSYALHTACSTSLVAVHLACQSLLLDECSMAVAGGASVNVPQMRGYLYQPGGLLSPDGSCRTFDAGAAGSNFGNGAGAVLLKRLADAIADRDHIYAVIRGSATNNDGAAKASFTAPGVEGQTEVLLEAMAVAEVDANDLSYIEAHGTATELGDSIEILALSEAFRASRRGGGRCAIGSAKTNLGHLETAAGVAGLIKTALALEHRQLPPSLHFERPNPRIELAASPFEVNTRLRPWPRPASAAKRIAGVSSFGIGSTNAHVILEEPPAPAPADEERPWQLLTLSARSESALRQMSDNLRRRLAEPPDPPLAPALDDVAYTLAVGRKSFEHRRYLVCRDLPAAVAALGEEGPSAGGAASGQVAGWGQVSIAGRGAAFLFPGLGEHYDEMGLGLYQRDPLFRQTVDRCAELLAPALGLDLRTALYPRGFDVEERAGGGLDLRSMLGRKGSARAAAKETEAARSAASRTGASLDRTALAQPALFVVEYALARLLMARGVEPRAMIGYSLGEYVCACLAGVLSLEDALRLVAHRAALIDRLAAGAMLAVPLDEAALAPWLQRRGLSLAAVNGVTGCVASGAEPAIEALASDLAAEGIESRRLETSHAFHSTMMQGAVDELVALTATLALSPPRIPYLSNVTGRWIEDTEATDPRYWARHMCQPVRFAEGVGRLLALDGEPVLLELGPGQSLTSFARLHPARDDARPVLSTLRQRHGGGHDAELFLGALGALWLAGVNLDLGGCWAGERRRRVPLPTYPFERQRYWVDADEASFARARRPGSAATSARDAAGNAAGEPGEPAVSAALTRIPDLERWLHQPVWREVDWPVEPGPETEGTWLLFADRLGVAEALAGRLRARGAGRVVLAAPGEAFTNPEPDHYRLRPAEPEDYRALLAAIGGPLSRVVHLWSLAPIIEAPDAKAPAGPARDLGRAGSASFRAEQERGLYSVVALARALSSTGGALDLVTHGLEPASDGGALAPARATLLAAPVVIPQELPRLSLRLIDCELPSPASELPGAGDGPDRGPGLSSVVDRLVAELLDPEADALVIAHRGGARRVREFEPVPAPPVPEQEAATAPRFRAGGTYLLLGGLGGIGLELADHLAGLGANLVLTRRTALPPRKRWPALLAEAPPDDKTARALRHVRRLEKAGAKVTVAAVDVADEARLRALVRRARRRFGALHGVVHAAGVLAPESFVPLARAERESFELHFRPKVHGLYALASCLEEVEELELCVLFSSISAILGGGLGSLAYSAANAFMDAFAARQNLRGAAGGAAWQSLDWDSWREAGHKAEAEDPAAGSSFGATLTELALAPAEGIEVLRRALALGGRRHLVVSTGDLASRFKQWVAKPRRGRVAATAASSVRPSGGALVERIARIWSRILGRAEIAPDANFFDLGGNSLLGLQVISEINRELGGELSPVELFEAPTVEALARLLEPAGAGSAEPSLAARPPSIEIADAESAATEASGADLSGAVAIVGMAGRYPGADDLEGYWRNLCDGVESVTFFDPEQLLAAGVDPATFADPAYVPARPVMLGAELFDAALFGYSPREAELMDPQHRVFLECAWACLEDAGYDPQRYPGAIGTFAGSALNTYLLYHVYPHAESLAGADPLQLIIGSDKDSLTTNVSYRLDLRGPSLAVQTYCSTSLVAVHLALRSLRAGECDMALAGGVSIAMPQETGYLYQPDSILSPDGRCRPFDARAAGTLFGNGVGAVLLKRLDAARADGDRIYAVVRGSAINNDGSLKAGYTAPSVVGQAQVVAAALDDAGVDPTDIDYVETHGTGTALGDPIEVAALTRAYRQRHADGRAGGELPAGFCALGSVKGNMGHLDRAAGIAGLTKAVLALDRGRIPPTLHFEQPNPKIDFAATPFFVNTALRDWPANPDRPRRAGVSALGFGGTNVHLVLEEAPADPRLEAPAPDLGAQLLVLSARTDEALAAVGERLGGHLVDHPEIDLADAAFTLQTGRRQLARRRFLVVGSEPEGRGAAAAALLAGDATPAGPLLAGARAEAAKGQAAVHFLFPGQGSQHPGMGRELYAREPVFRRQLERCAEVLSPRLGLDLLELLYPPASEAEAAARGLADTRVTQPALFAVEYALARMWLAWGIEPTALAGHSIGEYAAACLAGVFELEDALTLVAERGRLMAEMPRGAMLAVALPASEVEPRLAEAALSLAAVNAHDRVVVSGAEEAIERLARALAAERVEHRRLRTSHAFHSAMVEPAVEPLVAAVAAVPRSAPRIPLVSCLTGTWLRDDEATDPAYWGRQLRATVRFAAVLDTLAEKGPAALLEVGPGRALTHLARRHLAQGQADAPTSAGQGSSGGQTTPGGQAISGKRTSAVASLPPASEARPAGHAALEALGRLWIAGVSTVDWRRVHGDRPIRRVGLPTYPFERRRFCLDPNPSGERHQLAAGSARPEDWLWVPSWKRTPRRSGVGAAAGRRGPWLLLDDDGGLGAELAKQLRAGGSRVIQARRGARFSQLGADRFTLRPDARSDLAQLAASLAPPPEVVLFLWSLRPAEKLGAPLGPDLAALTRLASALDELAAPIELWLVTDGTHDVLGSERERASGTLAAAACAAIERHCRHLRCRQLDLDLSRSSIASAAAGVLGEVAAPARELTVALRGQARFVSIVEPVADPVAAPIEAPFAAPAADPAAAPAATSADGAPASPTRPEMARVAEGNGAGAPGIGAPGIGDHQVESYLILGGSGALGASVGLALQHEVKGRGGRARLVLADREPLPVLADWDALLAGGEASAEELEAAVEAYAEAERLGLDAASWPPVLDQRWRSALAELTPDPLPEGFSAAADALCSTYAWQLFVEAAGVEAGGCYRRAELLARLRPAPPYTRLVDYLLDALLADGWVEQEPSADGLRLRFLHPPRADADALRAELAERFGDFRPGLDCLAHCAAQLLPVLRGELDAGRVLYPDGSPAMLQGLMKAQTRFSISPALQRVIVETLHDLGRRRGVGAGRRLRLLEVGGGQGTLTWPLLDALAALPEGEALEVDYLFTDLQRPFVEAARRAARARGCEDRLRFAFLDLDRDPEEQGYRPFSFDAVVGLDVAHLTADLSRTLEHLRRLLVPEGLALLIEPGGDQRWVSLIWGLTEEWWRFRDDHLRAGSPLLDAARWRELLREGSAFGATEVLPAPTKSRPPDHLLLVAQAPRRIRDGAFLARATRRFERQRERLADRVRRVRALEASGAEVQPRLVDPASAASLAELLRSAAGDGALAGLLHCDGPWNDAADAESSASPLERLAALLAHGSPESLEVLDGALAGDLDGALGGRRSPLTWLVSPLTATLGATPGRELESGWAGLLAARAAANGGAPAWSSVVWGLGGDGTVELPPALAARALAALRSAGGPGPRVLLSPRSPANLGDGWNRPPAKLSAPAGLAEAAALPPLEEGRAWSEEEKGLAAIWSAVLGVERLLPSDSFFELGGDSLIATQLQARLRDTFGFEVPMARLFEGPTLEAQARAVAEVRAEREQEQQQKVLATLSEMSESDVARELEQLRAETSPHGALR